MSAAGVHRPTVIGVAAVVFATAIGLHEAGHAAAAWSVGGNPSLVSSTDVQGDFESVSRLGILWIGVAGSLVNWVVAVGSLALLASVRDGSASFFAWLSAAVNGLIPAVYMVVSPLLGFGDWISVLGRFQPELSLRLLTAAIGLGLGLAWYRLCARRLEPLLAGLLPAERRGRAGKLATTSWLTGGGLALTAALFSPLGLAWALPIAAGSTLGTTWPLFLMSRAAAARVGPHGRAVPIGPSRGWSAAGAAVGLAFVALLGPGVRV